MDGAGNDHYQDGIFTLDNDTSLPAAGRSAFPASLVGWCPAGATLQWMIRTNDVVTSKCFIQGTIQRIA